MASNFVANGDEINDQQHDYHHHHHHHGGHHHQAPSPRGQGPSPRGVRRSLSSNTAACGQGAAGGSIPKCVCAPATHAGSFKCRLHRTNSHGHSPPSPTSIPPPPAPVNSSRTPTVHKATVRNQGIVVCFLHTSNRIHPILPRGGLLSSRGPRKPVKLSTTNL
ncbi:unnamed protein product, partial [Musa textilis]